MEKKTYLIPATVVVALSQKDGILYSASDGEGKGLLGDGGGTNGKILKGDTKDEGDFDLWDE